MGSFRSLEFGRLEHGLLHDIVCRALMKISDNHVPEQMNEFTQNGQTTCNE